jgi:hypothetical protein
MIASRLGFSEMGQRKSAAEKRMEIENERFRAREAFIERLRRIQSIDAAGELLASYVSQSSPTRPLHSNFSFFITNFKVPNGASSDELAEYKRLVACFRKEGRLSEEALAAYEAAFKTDTSRHPFER